MSRVCARTVSRPSGCSCQTGFCGNIATDVLAAHQRNVLAEFRNEEIDEPASVRVLLRRHLVKYLGGRRVVLVQAIREIGVNARVLFFIADGEGQHLALGQIVEIAHRLSRGPNLE